jgi:hypothetical protein
VGRLTFALTSLVAALPAAFLAFLLVSQGFLKNVGNMGPLLMVMVGGTLALSGFVVLVPAAIMVFGGPKTKKAAPEKARPADEPAESSAAVVAEEDGSEVDILATSGEAKVVDADFSEEIEASDEFLSEAELDDTTAFGAPVEANEFTEEVTLEEDFDEIADEVILEDEDDEPKSKKKRR